MADTASLPESIDRRGDLIGNVKVTRQDWLDAAMEALVTGGASQVKILTLGEKLGVSRSSFYWYFRNRRDLLDALLERWEETNTAALVAQCEVPADTITAAVCNVFRCFIDRYRFDSRLDFAVRDWARRNREVRETFERSEETRLTAVRSMFERFGYPPREALTRARTLYYMQIGYYAADLNETLEQRNALTEEYVLGFTGKRPTRDELDALTAYVRSIEERDDP